MQLVYDDLRTKSSCNVLFYAYEYIQSKHIK